MGTLKLNKQVKKATSEAAEAIEKLETKTRTNAKNVHTAEEAAVAEVEVNELAKADAGFVEEIKELRTENETVYRRNDRTFRKIITATPTRYRDEDGELKDIKNTLTDNGKEIVNSENSFKVKFNKDGHSGKIFDLQKGNKVLTLSSVSYSKARGHVCGCTCELCAGKDNTVSATLDDGTEIQYEAMTDRIKENIIVKERQDSYEYNFTLNIGDLTVEEGEHNDLLLKDAETGKTEFRIPAPYMYDANKKRSGKVSYEIDVKGEELAIKVVADAEFINAEERAFPVTIDPQIVINSNISCYSREYENYNDFIEGEPEYNNFEARKYSNNEWITAFIDYSRPTVSDLVEALHNAGQLWVTNDLVAINKIYLIVHCYEGEGNLNINGTTYNLESYPELDDTGIDFYIDVSNNDGTISMKYNKDESGLATFSKDGTNAPRFAVDYILQMPEEDDFAVSVKPEIKEFELTDKVKGYFNLKNGDIVTAFNSVEASDFAVPLTITHINKTGSGNSFYGRDWHLNLDKKLRIDNKYDTENNTKYLYTDELGDNYFFSEKYYYMKEPNDIQLPSIKTLIEDKSNIKIDLSGNLTYQGCPVYKQYDCNGYTLIPEVDDFINTELIEQRQEKQVQLEEYLAQVKPILESYIFTNHEGKKQTVSQITTIQEKYDWLMGNSNWDNPFNYYFLTKDEAMQLSSLNNSSAQYVVQIKQLDFQKEQLKLQKTQLEFQKNKQIEVQLKQLNDSMELSKKIDSDVTTPIDFSTLTFPASGNSARNDEISLAREQLSYANALANKELITSDTSETTQKTLLQDQLNSVNKELATSNATYYTIAEQRAVAQKEYALILDEIDYFRSQKNNKLSQAKELFKNYMRKSEELRLIKLQTAVNFLRDKDGIISGFNEKGDLVLLADAFENYVSIVYDSQNRISEINDSNNKVIKFLYENGLLKSITDSRGREVSYKYEYKTDRTKDKLDTVYFSDGSKIELTERSDKVEVVKSSCYRTSLNHFNDSIKLKNINKEGVSPRGGTISVINVTPYSNGVRFEEDGNIEEFRFYNKGKIKQYMKFDNALMGYITNYEYETLNGSKKVTYNTNYSNGKQKIIIEEYDSFDVLKSRVEDWHYVSQTVKVKTETQYEYDFSGKLIMTTAKKFTNISNVPEETVTKYSYDAANKLILTESYVKGEELSSGKKYEENVYDEKGNCIKTISWNSLDSSSKFYSESVYAENGQVIADKDETGEVSAEYEYISGTNIVNSVKYANGSKLAYGRDPNNFEVTSVTQSTDEGECNQTDIIREYGVPIKVTSGNTVLEYEYDKKGRKTKVKVNGVEHLKSTYEDNKTENNSKVYLSQKNTIKCKNSKVNIVYKKSGILKEDEDVMQVSETLTVGDYSLYSKIYNYNGDISSIALDNDSKTISYTYNAYFNLTEVNVTGTENITESFIYNDYSLRTGKTVNIKTSENEDENIQHIYGYAYKTNAARDLDYTTFNYSAFNDSCKFKPLTDVNGRNTGKEIYYKKSTNSEIKVAAEYITYRKVGDHATNMPATIWFGNGSQINDSIKYKYDKSGNISEVIKNGHIVAKYAYDSLNRLVREDNKAFDKTSIFTYDNAGNITERCEYAYTSKTGEELSELECKHFSYDYDGDKLKSYNGIENFAYENETLTKYRGNEIQWKYGTKLSKYGLIEFNYDGLGRRISKKIGNNTISFTYDSDGKLISQSNGLEFVYDNAGVAGVIYGGKQYFYRKDALGNVIAILDNKGDVVVYYEYDAWGNYGVLCLNYAGLQDLNDENAPEFDAEHLKFKELGTLNPFRYRGYYYDTETELYFLQTRYYDPEVGRFISQDSIKYAYPDVINGLNLYAYCLNDPIKFVDYTGSIPIANHITRFTRGINFEGLYSKWVGRIGYSVSTTHQDSETGIFYSFYQNNNDWEDSVGVGVNLWNWFGIEYTYNFGGNISVGGNITPWFHYSFEAGLGGFNTTLGIDIGETSHDITFGIGLGLAAVLVGVAGVVLSGGALLEPVLNFFNKLFGW